MTTLNPWLREAATLSEAPEGPEGPEAPIELTPVEAAYVAMIESEYRAGVLQAQQLRAVRFAVVMKAHHIPAAATVTVQPGDDGQPLYLVVTQPPSSNGGAP